MSAMFRNAHHSPVELPVSAHMVPVANSTPTAPTCVALKFMALATKLFLLCKSLASLCDGVCGVVSVGSKEQVIRVNTGWNITTMANDHPSRDWAVNHRPSPAVSAYRCLSRLQSYCAVVLLAVVSLTSLCASPKKAATRTLNHLADQKIIHVRSLSVFGTFYQVPHRMDTRP